MLFSRFLSSLILVGASLPAQPALFARYFVDRTLRIDYFRGGDATEEFVTVDAVREEPGWGGPRKKLITPFERGRHQIRVQDRRTGLVLFAQGYSTVFAEWQTIPEAKQRRRVFRESVSVPYPRRPIRVTFLTRDRHHVLRETASVEIDPDHVSVRRDPPRPDVPIVRLIEHGPPETKVDLVLVAEGYPREQMQGFKDDAGRLVKALFSREPFKSHARDFNVTLVCAPSVGEGIDQPRKKLFRRTALEASFNTFALPRYVLVEDFVRLRDAVQGVPFDRLLVVINSERYGGGGIYNWLMTCTARHPWSEYVFVHEFGHALAGLADEYYSSQVAYEEFYPAGVEPLAPNITRLLGDSHRRKSALKWGDLVGPAVPLPTPWPQSSYDKLVAGQRKQVSEAKAAGRSPAELLELERSLDRARREWLDGLPHRGKVGAYEGGGYVARGVYRPFLDCTMFSRSHAPFCPVCQRAITRMIDYLVGRDQG